MHLHEHFIVQETDTRLHINRGDQNCNVPVIKMLQVSYQWQGPLEGLLLPGIERQVESIGQVFWLPSAIPSRRQYPRLLETQLGF